MRKTRKHPRPRSDSSCCHFSSTYFGPSPVSSQSSVNNPVKTVLLALSFYRWLAQVQKSQTTCPANKKRCWGLRQICFKNWALNKFASIQVGFLVKTDLPTVIWESERCTFGVPGATWWKQGCMPGRWVSAPRSIKSQTLFLLSWHLESCPLCFIPAPNIIHSWQLQPKRLSPN